MNVTQPLVTIDAPKQTLPAVRPAMPAGNLKISTIEQYAPRLARELLDTYDFSASVGKGKPASLSVAKAYSQVTTSQYRQLAKIAEYRAVDEGFTKGILGTLAVAGVGLGAAFLGMAGAHDFALGVISVIAGAGSLGVGALASDSIIDAGKKLPAELMTIANEPPLLPAAKSDQPA